ncbi:MAG: multidrug effflux MFS transporter [Simkaniaceae bacterium]
MKLSSQKKRIFFFLLLLVTLGQFGVDLYLPSLPHIAKSLQSTISSIKLTIPLYLLGFGISQLFYGPLSDAFGRKPILHFGFSLFFLGSLGCLLAANGTMLILFRTLQGLGIGAAIVNVRAIMRDAFHGKQMAKISAWIVMTWTITPIVAPVIGGYIQSYIGWRANFAVMLFYSLSIWLFLFFLLPETIDKQHQKKRRFSSLLRTYAAIFSDKVFVSFSFMSSFCYGYFISFVTASPFILQSRLGFSPVQYGWSLLLVAVGTALGSILCNRLVSSTKILHIIFAGSLIMLFSALLMYFFAQMHIFTAFALIGPAFLGSVGGGMLFPNCTTGAMTPHKGKAGMAGASIGFIQMFNAFIFSFIISHLPTKTALPLSLELLAITVLNFVLFIFYVYPHFKEESEEGS